MAGELRTSLNTFRFVKGAIDVSLPAVLANFDVAGTNYARKTQLIGITDTTLDLGDVATPGFLFAWNNDPTNFVKAGEDGSSYPVMLRAVGGWAVFEFNGAAIHFIADTAPVMIDYFLIEK
jgi:hypothetical protein